MPPASASTPDGAPGDQPRYRRPRGSLSRRLIIEAALALTEQEGYEALTFQALGTKLGAHPTAIYRHFRDKNELFLSLIEALHAESLAELPPPSDDWLDDIRQLALRGHDVFLRHPAVGAVAAVRTTRSENEFRIVDRIIGCLRRGGFDAQEAATYYRLISDFTLAYAAFDAGLAALNPQIREADLRAWVVDYPGLPPEEFPNIAATATLIPAEDDPGNFRGALELMLEALAARAAAKRRRRRPARA